MFSLEKIQESGVERSIALPFLKNEDMHCDFSVKIYTCKLQQKDCECTLFAFVSTYLKTSNRSSMSWRLHSRGVLEISFLYLWLQTTVQVPLHYVSLCHFVALKGQLGCIWLKSSNIVWWNQIINNNQLYNYVFYNKVNFQRWLILL